MTAVFILVIAALLTVVVWSAASRDSYDRAYADAASQKQAKQAEQDIQNRCVILDSASTMAECIEQIVKASREDQRAEQDTAAQIGMNRWAFWTALIALPTLITTAIGVYLVKRTLEEAQTTTRAAVDGAEAARAAVAEARETNRIASEVAHIDQRPWLGIQGEAITRFRWGKNRESIGFEFLVNITNFGKTPAIDVHSASRISVNDGPNSLNIMYADTQAAIHNRIINRSAGQVIFPNQSQTRRFGVTIWIKDVVGSETYRNAKVILPVIRTYVIYRSSKADIFYRTGTIHSVVHQEGDAKVIVPDNYDLAEIEIRATDDGVGFAD